jgi:hypothetical protein
MNDLDKPVYKASLTELEDLWRVKYGTGWTPLEEITRADETYKAIAQRLLAASRLERHQLADTHVEVFKLIEKE